MDFIRLNNVAPLQLSLLAKHLFHTLHTTRSSTSLWAALALTAAEPAEVDAAAATACRQ